VHSDFLVHIQVSKFLDAEGERRLGAAPIKHVSIQISADEFTGTKMKSLE